MGVKLCICIPTCNRSECMTRVLNTELEMLKKLDIHIWIYDSSTDNDTKSLVLRYQEKGYANLFYQHVEYSVHPNKKAYQIFQQAEGAGYDYVWLIHDHTVCTDVSALSYILYALEKGYDFYLLNMQSNAYRMTEIQSLDEFLVMGAWPLNSFGASIVKVASFVKGTDWKALSDKYLQEKTLNHAHIGFYFERAAQIENIKICRLEFLRECFWDFLRYQKTSWDQETIRICTECWGSNILMLPEVYGTKHQALQTQDKWFLTKYKLLIYKRSGQFGIRSFIKYRKWLKMICPEAYWTDAMIAAAPLWLSRYICCHRMMKRINKAHLLEWKVLIYGAGRHAVECAELLQDMEMDFDGFVVTKKKGNPDFLLGYPVQEAQTFLESEKALVIIAILTSGVREVEKYIENIKIKNLMLDYVIFE